MRLVLISGLSGSGKSTALKALEDSGYFCVDNIPPSLLPILLDLCRDSSRDITRVAAVVDIRGKEFLGDLEEVLRDLKGKGLQLRIIFLEASTEVLIERFSETRRRHPLEEGGMGLCEAVRKERELLGFLRERADEVIDTTVLTGHELRRLIIERIEGLAGRLRVHLLSFGYSLGLPREADMVVDVRFLPNPFYVKELRNLTGLDPRVSEYIFEHKESQQFLSRMVELLDFLIPLYCREGKSRLTVAIGCTGGKHRSPAVAEKLGSLLKERGQDVIITHRELGG
ncbi:MAG: RNase adapter RapZ [Deltaproteobacteria bacterium]|nr:MAG: RNase adapter RapZ [Deltaproteobacteria bacterium]